MGMNSIVNIKENLSSLPQLSTKWQYPRNMESVVNQSVQKVAKLSV